MRFRTNWLLLCGLFVVAGFYGCARDAQRDGATSTQLGPNGVGLSDRPYEGPSVGVMLTAGSVVARVTPKDDSVWGIRIDGFDVQDNLGLLFVTVTTMQEPAPSDSNLTSGASVEASLNVSTAGVTGLETWIQTERNGVGGQYHRVSSRLSS